MEIEEKELINKQQQASNSIDDEILDASKAIEKIKEEKDKAIKDLTAENEKLKSDYYKSILESNQPKSEEKVEFKSLSELRNDYIEAIKKGAPNYIIMEKSLALRNKAIEEGQQDPYLPFSPDQDREISAQEREEATATAEAFQYLVKVQKENGDLAFTTEFDKILKKTKGELAGKLKYER